MGRSNRARYEKFAIYNCTAVKDIANHYWLKYKKTSNECMSLYYLSTENRNLYSSNFIKIEMLFRSISITWNYF
ncbi:hypothetical protein DEU39_1122 [Chryseobacterium sp. AG363]|nr:hypothetical protein DEU39_1122 [Chryseobacterium sp. AG363]